MLANEMPYMYLAMAKMYTFYMYIGVLSSGCFISRERERKKKKKKKKKKLR